MNVTPIIPLVTTTTNLSTFTGRAFDPWGEWEMAHFTSYTGAEANPIPTDHGGLFRDGESYRIVLTDGLGHHDPKAIGAVAAEVLNEVSRFSISEQIEKARDESGTELSEEKAYQSTLKSLARAYKNREGTTLLQVEVTRLGEERIQLTIGKCGDSDLIVLDRKGKVRYATVDIKHHLKPNGIEIGLLAIGSNFSEKWLDDSTYIKTEIKIKEAFLVACSDGLTECLRQSDGSIDRERFRYAVLTGHSLLPDEPIPSFSSLKLTPAIISEHLQSAAKSFALRMQEINRLSFRTKQLAPAHLEAELNRIHAGDDTTIITLAVPNAGQSQAASSSSSGMGADIEGDYYRSFEEAFEKRDGETQVFYLEKMAKLALGNREFSKAAHVLNAALAINHNKGRQGSLLAKLEQLEILFFESLFSRKPTSARGPSIADYR